MTGKERQELMKRQSQQKKILNPPINIIVRQSGKLIRVYWKRAFQGMKPDGFKILAGVTAGDLREIAKIDRSGYSMDYNVAVEVTFTQNFFLIVVAFNGLEQSQILKLIQVKVNSAGVVQGTSEVSVDDVLAGSNNVHHSSVRVTEQERQQSLLDEPTTTRQDSQRQQPVQPVHQPEPVQEDDSPQAIATCSCGGDIFLDEQQKVYACGTCRSQFVQRIRDGVLVAVSRLINGVCDCCNPKRPLLIPQGSQYRRCSATGEEYADLNGSIVKLSSLDYGLCACCNPAVPLMLNQQGQVVCSGKRQNMYIQNEQGKWVRYNPEAPGNFIDKISEDLENQTAYMLPGGIVMPKND